MNVLLMKLVRLCFLSAILAGCQSKPETLSEYFGNRAVKLKSESVVISNVFWGMPKALVVCDSLLIAYDEFDGLQFSLVNLKTNKLVKRFGRYGRGPNESTLISYPYYNKQSKSFHFYAVNEKKVFFYLINDLVVSDDPQPYEVRSLNFSKSDGFYNTVVQYGDGAFIGNGWFHSGKYAITNKSGDLDTMIGTYQIDPLLKDLNHFELGNLFQGGIALHPEGNKLAYFSIGCDLIEVVELSKNEKYRTNRLFTYLPKFETRSNQIITCWDNPYGFATFGVTSKYIYGIYSGKDLSKGLQYLGKGDLLYVFDWNLKPVKAYKLDHEIWCMAVSDDDKYLFSVVQSDQLELVKWNLNIGI